MKVKIMVILMVVGMLIGFISNAEANEVYAFVISKDLQQTRTIINGFKESFPAAETAVLDLNGKRDTKKIQKFVTRFSPSVIISLGALASTTTIAVETEIPIVFAMVIDYQKYPELAQANVTGVSMEIPIETMFTQFKMLMPDVDCIGVPYHPEGSGDVVDEAIAVLKKMGIELVNIKVEKPKNMTKKLKKQSKKCGGLWMVADTKLYNRKTKAVQDLIAYAKDKKKPLLAFSEAFLKHGAFFSISIDYNAMGSQLALTAQRLVKDQIAPADITVGPPIGSFTVINSDVVELLYGDGFDEELYYEVDKVYPDDEE